MRNPTLKPIEIRSASIRLSTGYEVGFEEDSSAEPVKGLVDHLTNAIIGERIISPEVVGHDQMVDAIIEELVLVVQRADAGLLGLILSDFLYDIILEKLDRARGQVAAR